MRIPGVAAGLVLQEIDGQLYAIRDDVRPMPERASGGPFSCSNDGRRWLVEKQEEKLTPEQREVWNEAHDSLRSYARVHVFDRDTGELWDEAGILGALYFVIGIIRRGPMKLHGVLETPGQFRARVGRYCGAR